jgi:hypothetical protein
MRRCEDFMTSLHAIFQTPLSMEIVRILSIVYLLSAGLYLAIELLDVAFGFERFSPWTSSFSQSSSDFSPSP